MSEKVDRIFRPVDILFTLCFLKSIDFKSNQTKTSKKLKSIFILIRIIFIIIVWYILFRRGRVINDIVDNMIQLIQQLGCGITITATYLGANYTSQHLHQIKTLIKQNHEFNQAKTRITSVFIPTFIFCVAMYSLQATLDIIFYQEANWIYYSRDQYFFMTYGCFINVVYTSTIYTIGNIIQQQFTHLNNEVKLIQKNNNLNNLEKIPKKYTELQKQSESFSAAFQWFMLCKLITTYAWLLISLYYPIIQQDAMPWFTTFWVFFLSSELMLVFYYCDRIENEVVTLNTLYNTYLTID